MPDEFHAGCGIRLASHFRFLQRAKGDLGRKSVPVVQRPGTSSGVSRGDGELRALAKTFAENPTLKTAAAMLAAQRRARR
jgi:hypothetical protein